MSSQKLSDVLKAKIESRPTNTFLRDTDVTTEEQYSELTKAIPSRQINLPDNFDPRQVWKGLLSPVKNQGQCGSCWAFASTSALADRFNIQSVGLLNLNLSPTRLVLCDFQGKEFDIEHPETDPEALGNVNIDNVTHSACTGNTLYDAWRYLYAIGTNTDECLPYDQTFGSTYKFDSLSKFSSGDKLPLCESTGEIGDMCIDVATDDFTGEEYGTPARFYRCIHFYAIAGTPKDNGSEYNIRHNLYCWGPVTTGMDVYPDFYEFDPKTEIYEWNGKGKQVGGHAISIVGWGEKEGKPFWWIRNSWGVDWGVDGYFRMARGNNNCKIEENVIAGVPDFFYPANYHMANPEKFIWAENPEAVKERDEITNQYTITGGGIDPSTGYVRRTLAVKPWIDTQAPISIEDLPDWTKFIAGINAAAPNRYKYQRAIRAKGAKKQYSNQPFYITVVILGILVVLTVLVLKTFKK